MALAAPGYGSLAHRAWTWGGLIGDERQRRSFWGGIMRLRDIGKIIVRGTEVPCAISARSKLGACLVVQTTEGIPALFELVAPDCKPATCKVMWRDDKHLGVHFR